MATTGLGVPHYGELFHGQYELTGAYSRPGRPRDWERPIALAEAAQHQTELALHRARADQETMGEVVRGLSDALHPIDLSDGAPREGDAVEALLDGHLARARVVAEKLAGRTKAVEKVQALVPGWASLVRGWWDAVRARLAGEGLSASLGALVLTALIPAMYVSWVSERNHLKSEARKALFAVRETLLARVRVDVEWQSLPAARREALIELAKECARWFVRSTGSTEGHNGWLRLRFHQHHQVSPDWLETQRVVHNFLIRRADGTTAAQRFFGQEPRDLIEALIARMPPPPLPRTRKTPVTRAIDRLKL